MSARVRLSTQERRLIGGQTDAGDQQARVGQDQTGEGELRILVVLLYTHPFQHDLMKKRNCSLGLHGPWGESSSVFIRITFTFQGLRTWNLPARHAHRRAQAQPAHPQAGLEQLEQLNQLKQLKQCNYSLDTEFSSSGTCLSWLKQP
jgi:hypothetical protein